MLIDVSNPLSQAIILAVGGDESFPAFRAGLPDEPVLKSAFKVFSPSYESDTVNTSISLLASALSMPTSSRRNWF